MKGYLTPLGAEPALRLAFRSAQCSLCHHLGAEYGSAYRLLAGPDMVFLALLRERAGGGVARLTKRACVVAPLVTSLPVRETTADIRYAAAAGVYMAVEKLRDNYEDDGGWWRWLAWRALVPGQERARAALAAEGVGVAAITGWMAAQAQVERGVVSGLEAAAGPTRAIAAEVFGRAPTGASPETAATLARIGHHLGGYLFWLDNLLDLPHDVRAGGYNALGREFGVRSSDPETHHAAREHALAAASAEVDALAELVDSLPPHALAPYIRRTLVSGFRDKLRRYRKLDAAALAEADLPALLPPRMSITTRMSSALGAASSRLPARVRVAAAFLVAWVAPRSALAAGWWPEGADPALDAAADTGGAASSSSTELCSGCDPCASNFGWLSCEPDCDACCGTACDGACDAACD